MMKKAPSSDVLFDCNFTKILLLLTIFYYKHTVNYCKNTFYNFSLLSTKSNAK